MKNSLFNPFGSSVDRTLFSQEWRKICRRPSTKIALVALIFVVLGLAANSVMNAYWLRPSEGGGVPTELTGISAIKAMQADLAPFEGPLTTQRLAKIVSGAQAVYANSEYKNPNGTGISDNAFVEFIQPGREILAWVNTAYTPPDEVEEFEKFLTVLPFYMENFYKFRGEKLESELDRRHKIQDSDEKNFYLAANKKVAQPLNYGYAEGWKRLIQLMPSLGLIASFIISICLAPCYAFEKQCGAGPVLLAAKYGRTKLNRAKILASLAFASTVFVGVMALGALLILGIFGVQGGAFSWQIVEFFSCWPLSLGQVWGITLVLGYLGGLLIASLTLLLSCIIRASFPVVGVSTAVIFIQPFLSVTDSGTVLSRIPLYFPEKIVTAQIILGYQSCKLFGVILPQPMVSGAVTILLTLIFAWVTYEKFRHEEITC